MRPLSILLILLLSAVPEPARGREQPGDGDIATAVELELMSQGLTIAVDIDVEVRDGIVTFRGSVDSLLDVERALEVARSTRGVRSVVSSVAVTPAKRSDDDVERDLGRRLARDPATDDLEIDVDVRDGVVRLVGSAQSWQQKRFATRIAEGVSGVRVVVNDLQIDYGEARSDEDIAADVRRRLRSDVTIRQGLVEAKVEDGSVELTGFVGSAAEREYVYSKAWVRGVRAVDASAVEVRPWARDPSVRRNPPPLTDGQIRGAIRDALVYDPRIAWVGIDVEVDQHVAYLRGSVATALARREAGEIARNTTGVVRVRNLIKVRPPERRRTADLVADVREALAAEPEVASESIAVTGRHGRIHLDGWADGERDRKRAAEVAESVPGVIEVQNRLVVSRPPYARTDGELEKAIEEQLYWDAAVDETSIEVEVEDGVATLRGAVGDWTERERAAENAFEAGALEVRNRLGVRLLAPEDARA